jgi:hypothetical protein
VLAWLAVAAASVATVATPGAAIAAGQSDAGAAAGVVLPFGPGESLSYAVTYLGAPAGMARIDVGSAAPKDGTETWPLVVTVKSGGLVDRLFPIRDRYVDWWDPATGRSVDSSLSASEGGKHTGFHIRFERQRAGPDGGIAADTQVWTGSEREASLRSVERDAQDVLSAMFWLRTRPLAVGDHDTLPIFMGKLQWPLGATVLGRESVPTALGPIDCMHVRLSATISGKLGNRRDLDAFFSADPRHLPVLLDSGLLVGTLEVRLNGVVGGLVGNAPSASH